MAAPDPSNRWPESEQGNTDPPASNGAGDSADPDQTLDQIPTLDPGDDPDATMAYRPAGAAGDRVGTGTVVPSVDDCIRDLTDSGLLVDAEIASFRERIAQGEGAVDAQALARELVRAGRLTAYQAGAVLQGKTRGLVIGNYLVLDKLGAGGMGMVFKARHRRLKRIVALKLLPPSMARDESSVLRFQREAKAAAKLSHRNVVAVLDADEYRGLHFLVMEYVEGRDLSRVVRELGPLPITQAVDYIAQAARGLKAASEAGVVHRDIKPSNLLLEPGGTVKILDMGLARLDDTKGVLGAAGAEPDAGLTQSNLLMGTVDYMSPEQAFNPKHADLRSDIYSLGCTLHFLLIGRPPYAGETLVARLIAHREQPIPVLSTARPDIPKALDGLLARMLAKAPEDRISSLDELIDTLEECRATAAAAPAPVNEPRPAPAMIAPQQSQPGREHRFRQRTLLAAAGAGLVVLVLMATAIYLGRSSERRNEPTRARRAQSKPPLSSPPALEQEVRSAPMVRESKQEPKETEPVVPPQPMPFGVTGALRGHVGRVNSVAVSEDGQRALSGGQDGTVRLWDLATGAMLRREVHDGPVFAVALSPDGRIGVSGSRDKTVGLWDLNLDHTGGIHRLEGHSAAVFAVAMAQGGRIALSGGDDKTVRIWDIANCRADGDPLVHDGAVVALATLADDGVLVGCDDGTLAQWDLKSRQMVRRLRAPGPVLCVAVSPDGLGALSGHRDGLLVHWDLDQGLEAGRMAAHGDLVRCAAFLPDGRRALAGSQAGILVLWNVDARRVLYTFPRPRDAAAHAGQLGVAVLPDGLHGLTAETDAMVRPWTLPLPGDERAAAR
jgi:serine/threonine protein kinase/WD40 repeat protein